MGKFNTRQGLSSLANSDVTGQFGVYGGGASIPLLVDGATNRLLTLSDTNSGSVFYVQDADGTRLFDITTTGITVGGNYTLPLTDGTSSQYLTTDGSGAVTWEDLPAAGLTYIDVHNNTGATLSKGTPVYVTGTHASGKPTVAGTDANFAGKTPAIGLVSADISNGTDGTVLAAGTLTDIDTSAYTAGDALYVSETQGELTSTRPTSANSAVQKVALVTRSHATNGTVIVMGAGRTNDIPNNVAVEDLWNVDAHPTSADNIDGTSLIWHDYMSRWEAWAPVSGFMAYDATGGTTVSQAKAVKRQGSLFSGGRASVSVSLADSSDRCIGVAYADPGSDNRLVVATTGLIGGIDTSAWSVNDVLYVSGTTAGELVNTPPTTGTVQPVAIVVASSATTGILMISANPSSNGTGYLTGIEGEDVGTLNNVDVTGATSGDVLQFDGSNWVDATLALNDLSDVDLTTTAPTTNDVLQYNGTSWVPAASSTPTLTEVLTEGNISTLDAQVGGMTVSQSDNGSSYIALNSIADGTDWPALAITSTTASAATNDYIGSISWFGQNDAAQNVNYGSIGMQTTRVVDGDEDGAINFNVMGDGTLSEVLELKANSITARKSVGVIGSVETQDTGTLKGFEAISTDGTGAEWDAFAISRYTVSAADNDSIGTFAFNHMNDATQSLTFAAIEAIAEDVTDGTEDGGLVLKTAVNGTETEGLRVTGGTVKVAGAFTLPTADGSANQVLQTNGSGTVSWAAAPAPSDIADIGNVTVSSPVTNQVLIWNGVASEWQNNNVPVPTLAEVTASGASTSTTVTFASILQTGSTLNVAASGNHYAQLRATTLEVGTSATEQYQFPASDGNAGEVLTTDGAGALSFGKARSMTFSNSGVHQLTTANDTHYRYCSATTATNSTYWGRTSTSAPTSITRTAQYAKAGHVIPVDITDAVVNATVSISVSASASSDSAATEYNGDTVSFYLYRWADGGSAVQVATWTDVINGGVSYAEEQSSPTEFTLTASAGDSLFLVSRCLENATATRYMSMQYTIDIQY